MFILGFTFKCVKKKNLENLSEGFVQLKISKIRQSKVWRHFKDNVDDEGAKCKYCGNTFASKKRKVGTKPGAHSVNLLSENSACQ